jgi:transcriptional regulator with XRE-family HTH domain
MKNERPVNPLRGRRSALGLSQADVAAHFEKSQSWYSLIETGEYEPTSDEADKLAALLKCAVADIFPAKAA